MTNRFLVEIGAADGAENCTRNLVESGWTGLWVEADPTLAKAASGVAAGRVRVAAEAAQPESIKQLLANADVPERPDLLVLDIDGNDWWVLGAVLATLRPRVLVAEYNSTFPPGRWWVQPFRRDRVWDRTFRHGASLEALAALARAHGLLLVGCDSVGVNAFFVSDDEVVQSGLPLPGSVKAHYVGPWFSSQLWGHGRTRPSRHSMPELSVEELQRLSLQRSGRTGESMVVALGVPVGVSVRVHNGAGSMLTSGGPKAVHSAIRWSRVDDPAESWNGARRADLARPIAAGKSGRIRLWAPAPVERGTYFLEVTLVQEGVAFVDDLPGQDSRVTVRVEVVD